MRTHRLSLFLIASATLCLELLLTRVFDVILTPNLAYMVITCAMFAFGLAGIYLTLRESPAETLVPYLAPISVLFSVAAISLLPIFNSLPFDYERIPDQPFVQALLFAASYAALVTPFFLSGLVVTVLFTVHARRIQSLYFWDLTGAALGCVLIVPFLPSIGPGGLLFLAAGLGLFAAALFTNRRALSLSAMAVGVGIIVAPWLRAPDYFEFDEHLAKRGVKAAKLEGRVEVTRWDPVSKIDVFEQTRTDPITGEDGAARKHIAYDGGTQSSHFFPFDGDYDGLRRSLEQGTVALWDHFWHRGVLASHYLKRDSGPRVLVLGSAGGQETKAALMYGASHVDAVEMVGAVVELGLGRYAEYNGQIFNDPRVRARVDEGRSFLRSSDTRYDIIQIHSNHTSSSIAAGTGAMSPAYLQTAEAYEEYFDHLSDTGVLHINHHFFVRMISTAASAWKNLGRTDFSRHVLLFGMVGIQDPLPTFLVKMSPWTQDETDRLESFFLSEAGEGEVPFELLHHPLRPEESFLGPEFFSGELSESLLDEMDYHVAPATDDKPFFNFLRKRIATLEPNRERFLDTSSALILNSQLRKGLVPMDLIHLVVTGFVSLLFAVVFILLPLYKAEVGRAAWPAKYAAMTYFSCLGAGFIIIELVFIQIFMKLIGYPVYTYALVIFALLVSAGLGSLASSKLSIGVNSRWTWPFAGTLLCGALFTFAYPALFDVFLSAPTASRILIAAALVFPLGFFLGMPFPLGILALGPTPRGAVAWAWGLNGLFTIVGGLASVILSLAFGFRVTILIGLSCYVVAFVAFSRLRRSSTTAAHESP